MKRILIIEDEPDVAETMKMLLEREGFSAEYTLDARKGLKMVKKFDLLLLDIIMPEVSGREVLAELKKREVKTPVIVVSAVGLPMEISDELARKYPGVGFVPKTAMHTELIAKVKKILGK